SQLSCLAPGVLSRGDIINFLHGVGVAADELFYGRDLCCGSGRLYVVDQYSIASVCVCSTRSVTQRVGTNSSPDRTATSRNRYSDVSNNGFYKCSVAGTALGPRTRYVSGSVLGSDCPVRQVSRTCFCSVGRDIDRWCRYRFCWPIIIWIWPRIHRRLCFAPGWSGVANFDTSDSRFMDLTAEALRIRK